MARDPLLGCFGWQPSEMPRANQGASKVWLVSLKFIMTIMTAIAAFAFQDKYRLIKRYPELGEPPYNSHVELSQLLAYVGLMTIFPWIFISGGIVCFVNSPWIHLVGLIDFALAMTVAVGLSMQAVYLPATERGCIRAGNWQVHESQESFFTLVAKLKPLSDATVACKSFVSNWTLGMACLFFQMLIAYIGIFSDGRERSILNPWRPLFNFLFVLVGPPLWMKVQIVPRIRFAYHYLIQSVRRMHGQEELELATLNPYICREPYINVSNHKLQQILNIEHVLLNVVDYLCYEDVINFALSSKAVREAVYPCRDLEYRVPKLKKHCCETTTKKSCLYCNKKICMLCKKQHYYPGLPGQRHVTRCKPCCPRCYYLRFSVHPSGFQRVCLCRAQDRGVEFQDMCRTCSARDRDELQATRHKRFQQEARDIAEGKNLRNGARPKCANCKRELKDGMRFWICGRCNGECKDKIHPPYVKTKKERDLEAAEQEGALETENEGALETENEGGEPSWRSWVRNIRSSN